jgi:sugar phosphate isomerase/epimerase
MASLNDVALSTMWAIGQFQSLAGFFTAAKALGFTRFELNHAVNSSLLDGLNLNGQRITSIHEPCPADLSTSVLKDRNWLISAPNEDDRQRGVAAVRRSVDLAHKLGVQVVIVHPGRVDIDQELEMALIDLYKQGKADKPVYAQAKERLVAARAAQAEVNMRSVRRSLVELAAYAGRAGVRLALENRYHYLEFPLLDEMGALLDLVDDGRVGFWYDVGHAETLARLGFGSHEEWLRRYASRMIGVHLHDIKGLRDHHAAGLGEIDWDMVAAYLPADAIRTCEFRNDNTPEQIVAGLQFLADKGCVTQS